MDSNLITLDSLLDQSTTLLPRLRAAYPIDDLSPLISVLPEQSPTLEKNMLLHVRVIGISSEGLDVTVLTCLASLDTPTQESGVFRETTGRVPTNQIKDDFYALNYMLDRVEVGSDLVALVLSISSGVTLSLRNSLIAGRTQHSLDPEEKVWVLGLKDAGVPEAHRWNMAELDSRLQTYGLSGGRHGVNLELSNARFIRRMKLRYSKIGDIQNSQWAKDLYSSGLDMQAKKEFSQALSHFDTAIHFDPSLYHPYIAKACLLVNQHKYQKAMDSLMVISRIQPDNQQVLAYMDTVSEKYLRFKEDLKLVNKHDSPKHKYLF